MASLGLEQMRHSAYYTHEVTVCQTIEIYWKPQETGILSIGSIFRLLKWDRVISLTLEQYKWRAKPK